MIKAMIADKPLRKSVWKLLRSLLAMALWIICIVAAIEHDYARATFDLLLAFSTCPELWLPETEEVSR